MAYTLTGYTGSSTTLSLPTTIDAVRVETIGQSCFRSKSTVNVTGDSILTIGNYAFLNCTSMTTAIFPTCTSTSGSAFYGCTKLSSVSLPVVESIAAQAFRGCTALTTVSFPNCKNIGTYAFSGCTALKSIYLMSTSMVTLAQRGTSIFRSCTGYKVYVPTTLKNTYTANTNWKSISASITGI